MKYSESNRKQFAHTDPYMTQVVMMHKMGENYYYNCVYVKDISEANSKIVKATQNG